MSSRVALTSLLSLGGGRGVVTAWWDRAQDLLACGSTRQLTSEAAHERGATHSLLLTLHPIDATRSNPLQRMFGHISMTPPYPLKKKCCEISSPPEQGGQALQHAWVA